METTDLIIIVACALSVIGIIATCIGLAMLQVRSEWIKKGAPAYMGPHARAGYLHRAQKRSKRELIKGVVYLVLGIAAILTGTFLIRMLGL